MRVQYITTTFCNPCDNNSNVTQTCSPLKCPLANMAPQYQATSFDEDYDGVTYFIVGCDAMHLATSTICPGLAYAIFV